MPIRISYTDEWAATHAEALAEVSKLEMDYDATDATVTLKIYGSDAEYLGFEVPHRMDEDVYIQLTQTTPAMRQAAVVLRDEIEKILQASASPSNGQLTSTLDYTSGTIVEKPTE